MNKFNHHYYLFFTFKENINLLLYSFSWLTTNNDDIPNSTSLVNCSQNIYYAVHYFLLQLTKTKETIFCFLHQVLILLTYRVFFLLVVVFDWVSCLHFSSDFVHRYLIFFWIWYAIKWGIDHDCIVTLCWERSQYVKDVFFDKLIFSGFRLNFGFCKFDNTT